MAHNLPALVPQWLVLQLSTYLVYNTGDMSHLHTNCTVHSAAQVFCMTETFKLQRKP